MNLWNVQQTKYLIILLSQTQPAESWSLSGNLGTAVQAATKKGIHVGAFQSPVLMLLTIHFLNKNHKKVSENLDIRIYQENHSYFVINQYKVNNYCFEIYGIIIQTKHCHQKIQCPFEQMAQSTNA